MIWIDGVALLRFRWVMYGSVGGSVENVCDSVMISVERVVDL